MLIDKLLPHLNVQTADLTEVTAARALMDPEAPPLPPALQTILGLMSASPMPMVVWWGTDLVPHTNEAYSRLLRQPGEPLQANAWGAHWPGVASNLASVRRTGQAVWHENSPLPLPHTPDGEFCGTYSYNPIVDAQGVAGVLFVCSRFYRTSAVQADGRFGYAAVIHSMDVGFAIVEALEMTPHEPLDYWFVEVNEAWAQQTGRPGMQGQRISALVQDREPFWADIIHSVMHTGISHRTSTCSQKFGRTLDVFAMRIGGAGSVQVALLVRDISAEVHARQALQRSEERAQAEALRAESERLRLDAVLDATPVAVFVTDANQQLVRANLRAREEWGEYIQSQSKTEMGWRANGTDKHGQPLRPENCPLTRAMCSATALNTGPCSSCPLTRAMRGETSREIIELDAPQDARQRKVFLVTSAPIVGLGQEGAQTVQGAVVAAMDITDRVQAEQALQQAHQRKDEFLAMLAHELRNPLAPIGAAAELMSRPEASLDLMQRTSAIILRQVKHMTGLIDDLLDISRVSRGTITLDQECLDTTSVMNDALEQVSPLLRTKRHSLELVPLAQPLLFEGDRKRIIQVLSNLLNNAIKYTPEEGQIKLSLTQMGERLEIRVKDNGQGMDEHTLAHAFELFVQASRQSDRQQGGLGIGLALVKKLVELHGGQVSASSAGPGQGSEFVVSLPIHCPVQATPSALQTLNKSALTSLKVMVVDDHVDAALTLSMLIEAEGYSGTVVHRPEQALEAAKHQPPDAFILDIGLPGMDGRELARRLRAQPSTASALLIALSGYAQPEDMKSALSAGFDHYLVKPVDTQRLLDLLAERAQPR